MIALLADLAATRIVPGDEPPATKRLQGASFEVAEVDVVARRVVSEPVRLFEHEQWVPAERLGAMLFSVRQNPLSPRLVHGDKEARISTDVGCGIYQPLLGGDSWNGVLNVDYIVRPCAGGPVDADLKEQVADPVISAGFVCSRRDFEPQC